MEAGRYGSILRITLAAMLGVAGAGCLGGEQTVATDTVRGAATAASFGYPKGLTCGISYFSYDGISFPGNGMWWDGYCESSETVNGYCTNAVPFGPDPHCGIDVLGADQNFNGTGQSMSNKSIGDRGGGLESGEGFYAQELAANFGDVSNPDWLELPQGTVCGFRETKNDAPGNIRCMDRVPWGSTTTYQGIPLGCPFGWTYKWGWDHGAASGEAFGWCEYNDMHNVCPPGSPCALNQPYGLACGVTDTNNRAGRCMGLDPLSQGCPSGYYLQGPLDAGASSGQGTAWCWRHS